MSGAVVGVVATAGLDTRDAAEFLRALAALVALDVPVRLFEGGPGAGALTRPDRDLTADGEHYLAALADEGVRPEPEAALPGALAMARSVMVLADPGRPAVPEILDLPAGMTPSPAVMKALWGAGQVRLG